MHDGLPDLFLRDFRGHEHLEGGRAERWRRWDSCFTQSFSYIHGGSVRLSPKSRYRQWLTHKLASWIDQFGTSGCVGCFRCITWCPVGIDITQEAPGAAPGAIHLWRRPEAFLAAAAPRGSTHLLGLADALALAAALGRLPKKLIVYGIEASRFGMGERPSPEVAAAVEELARRLARRLRLPRP